MRPSDLGSFLVSLGLVQSSYKPEPLPSSTVSSSHTKQLPPLPIVGNIAATIGLNTAPEEAGAILDNSFKTRDTTCSVDAYEALDILVETLPPFDTIKANVYRYRQQTSVNLGSWFVQELWMVPSLFTCAADPKLSEIDIATGWGSVENARMVLERHWDTFITEDDFRYLQSIGINTVRIPIGYWTLGPLYCLDSPFEAVSDVYRNSWPRLLRAIGWAGKYGIGVLVDLHGAYGSQNGQTHSGVSDGQARLLSDERLIEKTIDALIFLTQQLASITNVVGIQILNEPTNTPGLTDFYTRAIESMRKASPAAEALPFYIHDGFVLDKFIDFVANRTDFVVVDHHSYFVFTPDDASESAASHTIDVDTTISDELEAASNRVRKNLVIDEWSCGLTDESLAKEDDPADARRKFCEGQMQTYANTTAGWGFWSYMKEGCDTDQGWCFRNAVGKSLPSTFFSYAGQSSAQDRGSAWGIQMALENMEEHANNQHPSLGPPLMANPAAGSVKRLISRKKPQKRYQRHHHIVIHQRRTPLDRTTRPPWATVREVDPEQMARSRGYGDGFRTAIIFARHDLSKLGFTGQYIHDSLAAVGSDVIPLAMGSVYAEGFAAGLADAEGQVEHALEASQAAEAVGSHTSN